MSLNGLAEDSRPRPSELRVNMVNMRRALDAIIGNALACKGFTFFTVNLDHMVKLDKSGPFRDAYARADYITADGWPIVWLARGPDRLLCIIVVACEGLSLRQRKKTRRPAIGVALEREQLQRAAAIRDGPSRLVESDVELPEPV